MKRLSDFKDGDELNVVVSLKYENDRHIYNIKYFSEDDILSIPDCVIVLSGGLSMAISTSKKFDCGLTESDLMRSAISMLKKSFSEEIFDGLWASDNSCGKRKQD
jgi:hypothetical protein